MGVAAEGIGGAYALPHVQKVIKENAAKIPLIPRIAHYSGDVIIERDKLVLLPVGPGRHPVFRVTR